MRILRYIVLSAWLALVCSASAAFAETAQQPETQLVRVTAGDQGATSRIAFNFRPDHGFRVERAGRQITVLFPGAAVRFANNEVYPRRQASRVVFAGPDTRADAAAFTLKFACDCDADVALDASNRVLVQVREKGVVPDAPPPVHSDAVAVAVAPGADKEPTKAAMANKPPAMEAKPMAPTPQPILLTRGHVPRQRPNNRRSDDGTPMHEPDSDTAVASNQNIAARPLDSGALKAHEVDRLRQSLEWAAQQGFLDKAGDIDLAMSQSAGEPPPNLVNVPPKPAEAAHQVPNQHQTSPAPPPPADVVAQRDGPDVNALHLEEVKWACTGPVQPPVVDWDGTDPLNKNFLLAIGRQQAAVAELPAPEAMRRMAMFYLAHGMTREALASLNSSGEPMPQLRDAMLVLLGRGDDAGAALLEASPCSSDISVWRAALLKMRGYRKLAEWAAKEAIGPLASFPPFPRTLLALELAEASLNQGNAELADAYLNLVDPAPGQVVAAQIAMLRGRKALLQGQTERSNWYFSQALDGDPEIRRQVRIALIQDAVDNGKPIPPWALDVTRGALFDYRGDRRLLPLALLAADVHRATEDYAAALEELAATSRRLPAAVDRSPIATKAKALLAAALTTDTVDDPTALQLFTDYGDYVGDDPASQAAGVQLAQRMLNAGLPSIAKRVLMPLVQIADAKPEWRRMLAEAELLSGDPESALRTLEPLSGNTAIAAIRRQALATLGQYEAAASVATAVVPDGIAAAELRWAAGDWASTAKAFGKLLAEIRPENPSPAAGNLAVRALAAAYMAGGMNHLGGQAETAVAIAKATGHGDAAAALTSLPLPGNLTLPDTITTVLNRSQQVSQIFPPMAKGS